MTDILNVWEMPIEIFEALSPKEQHKTANLISVLSKSNNSAERKVAPVEPEDIFLKYFGIVAMHNGEFAGYIAASQPTWHDNVLMCKVGSLVVAPLLQQRGIGSVLVEEMTESLLTEVKVPFAFCSDYSIKAFLRAGYIPALDIDIPEGETSLYGNKAMVYPMNTF